MPLARRALAEFLGTGLLVAVVVGSGIMAAELSRDDGIRLLANSLATAGGLGVLILLFGPVSGAHLNPVVSLAAWALGRRDGTGLALGEVLVYVPVQLAGGLGGTVLAHLMFARPALQTAAHDRSAGHLLLGELVATAGLVALVFALSRQGRAHLAPAAVGAYIGAAYWFTSSTSFANPAVTLARSRTDTFAGIAPGSVPGFVAAQFAGAVLGCLLVAALYPRAARSAAPETPKRTVGA
ncbi:aquaporin family protein [Actinomadura craniellae]|uniref:Aquaporin family protein n=1 Tax=Actinomadura craniellae TaxID=2231787 RepID=A0A365H932_9ACTN|nr:aquaporin family protein [Actinomadura craniellae]